MPHLPLPLSVAMIVKNETAHLADALASVVGVSRQVVVVDTGSEDGTPELAGRLGAEVHYFPWNGSFSDARNASLQYATEPWILVLDADEQLVAEDLDRLQEALSTAHNDAYHLRIVSLLGQGHDLSEAYVTRLFRNHRGIQFSGVIHEQVLPSLAEQGLSAGPLDVRLIHTGYMASVMEEKDKVARNLALLVEEAERGPHQPYVQFQLGQSYLTAHRWEDAAAAFQRSLEYLEPGHSLAAVVYSGLVKALTNAGKPSRALKAIREGLWHFPKYTDLEFQRAMIFLHTGKLDQANEAFLQALRMGPPEGFLQSDTGIGTYLPKLGLSEVAQIRGDFGVALAYCLSALKDQPRWVRTWVQLAQLTEGTAPEILRDHLRLVFSDQEILQWTGNLTGLPPIFGDVLRTM